MSTAASTLDPGVRARIDALLDGNRVVLFMKGVPGAPQCGFSAKASGILNTLGVPYVGVDVLADPEIREGIKAYGSWPTVPQLYIDHELVGGSDIVEEMLNSGELYAALGLPAPDRTPPQLHVTAAALEAIRAAMADTPAGVGLHLAVDAAFNAQFQLKPVSGHEIIAEVDGLKIHLDLASAPRAQGLEIDWVEDARGAGLSVRNPNAPSAVKSLSVQALQQRIAAGDIDVIDVRPAADRATAPFPHPHRVLDATSMATLGALPKDTPLAFLCHHGNSSRQAAEQFRTLGFREIYNVEGGIDAWSQQIDPGVARY